MHELVLLFVEFFKIGLFSIGGGLATLPFLYRLADKYDWFNYQMIGDMIAVSESTPGPLGVNMATFTGFQHSGVLGGLIATIGLVFPSVVVIIMVSKALEKFRDNIYVERVFETLRPTVTGMIGAAGFGVIMSALIHKEAFQLSGNLIDLFGIKEFLLFVLLLFLTNKYKKHPIIYIAFSAVIGISFQF